MTVFYKYHDIQIENVKTNSTNPEMRSAWFIPQWAFIGDSPEECVEEIAERLNEEPNYNLLKFLGVKGRMKNAHKTGIYIYPRCEKTWLN